MKRRRVKITGIGPVTPAGIGREAFWEGMLAGRSYVRPFTKLADEHGEFVAAEVKSFKLADYFDEEWARGVSRMSQFGIAATLLALRDAGLSRDALRSLDPVLMVGSALMDPNVIQTSILAVARKGSRFARPKMIRDAIGSATSSAIVHALETSARVVSFQSACCSGLDAVGFGADMIRRGEASIVIAGGTEAPLYQHPMLELRAANLSPTTSENAAKLGRPFDLWRTTGVIGEGACFVILEAEESPRPAYAYLNGFGYSNDVNGDLCGGLLPAIRLAMANSMLKPEDIDSISTWGPGHAGIDRAESTILQEALGKHLGSVPAYSIKGAIGNPFGAAGAMQVAAAAMGVREGVVLPTVNWERPDPSCPLNLSSKPRWVHSDHVMINAHGISGSNSCLILDR